MPLTDVETYYNHIKNLHANVLHSSAEQFLTLSALPQQNAELDANVPAAAKVCNEWKKLQDKIDKYKFSMATHVSKGNWFCGLCGFHGVGKNKVSKHSQSKHPDFDNERDIHYLYGVATYYNFIQKLTKNNLDEETIKFLDNVDMAINSPSSGHLSVPEKLPSSQSRQDLQTATGQVKKTLN